MMPALLTSTSTASTPSANARTEARLCRSSLRTSTSPVMPAAAASPLPVLRQARITLAPTRASSRAVTSPRPLLAPVTITVRPANEGRSAAVHPVMADTLAAGHARLLFGDVEPGDDRLDVGRLRLRLVGVAGHGELNQVALVGRRRAGGDDDPVVAVHPPAVEVVAALDHRRRESLEVVEGSVELLEVLRQFGVGVPVLD